MKLEHLKKKLKGNARKTQRRMFSALLSLLAVGSVFQGILLAPVPAAIAASLDGSQLIARGPNPLQTAEQKAKSDLDTVGGYGTSDQVEGQIEEAAGSVKKAFGNAGSEVEGAAQQAEGRAKRDIGKTKKALSEAGEEAESAVEDAAGSIKGFFRR